MNNGTVKAIAEECGVSVMTVSRALRNNNLVKEETRKRILQVAERVGYIRSPRRGRPAARAGDVAVRKVQLIVNTTGSRIVAFYSQLLVVMERYLSERDCECVVRACDGDYQQFIGLLAQVKSSDAVANMIVGGFNARQLKALFEAAPGAVLLDNPGDPAVDVPYVSFAFDNVEASRIAVRHLLSGGRRRILLVGGTPEHFFTREIEQGYREILAANAMTVDEELIMHADFTPETACEKVAAALNSGLRFDAVFTNDEMASGVYRALFERGLKIPADVAVCGCDGLPVGIHLFPKLTTVALDYDELGKMAVRYLFDELYDYRMPYRVRILPELEVRESSAC